MSILIKDMEMPVTCCHCPLMGYDPDREWLDSMARTGANICVLTGELIDNTKREEHCPLVPVPPHGRLIDESAIDLSKYEKAAHDALHNGKGNILYDSGVLAGARAITQLVRRAPTIIPAEEDET